MNFENHVYELFKFVPGSRYSGSVPEVIDAGRQLGLFHRGVSDFSCTWKPLRQTFHDSAAVRQHLKNLCSKTGPRQDDKSTRQVAGALLTHYNRSSTNVNGLGFDSWPEQIIHGDWHPGNLLFASQKVTGVFDFDSVKIAPSVTDLANGLLQFSIVSGRPNPTDWPAYLDQGKLANFIAGYQDVIRLDDDMRGSLFDQMIETMIAEAILPVATTGFFGNFCGLSFLEMIRRKCDWIDQNRSLLKEAILC